MARFSVTEAAGAGFGVATHKPLAVLGWAAAMVVADAACRLIFV